LKFKWKSNREWNWKKK